MYVRLTLRVHKMGKEVVFLSNMCGWYMKDLILIFGNYSTS